MEDLELSVIVNNESTSLVPCVLECYGWRVPKIDNSFQISAASFVVG